MFCCVVLRGQAKGEKRNEELVRFCVLCIVKSARLLRELREREKKKRGRASEGRGAQKFLMPTKPTFQRLPPTTGKHIGCE